jgi:aspartyl-tRNA(Asn)/glutamyl-tRNA(Gln) amidotransferase subunit B
LSGIDLNRAGTPLLEIVNEPELRSAEEAVAYARTLHALVMWLGISNGDMQNGNFRCDANVSVRPVGQKEFGTRCEIKNLNSFRFLQDAIEYEVRRQIELIEDGGQVVQATRLYDPDKNETREMRTKEDSMDYRYFPDPDLLPLDISREWLDEVKQSMPELPHQLRERLMSDFGLSQYDATMLTTSRGVADYYLALAEQVQDKKIAANWVMGELSAALNQSEVAIENSPVSPAMLAKLISRVLDNTLNNKGAKTVFAALWAKDGDDVDQLIEKLGLKQISDTGAIEKIVDEVIANNPKNVEEFRAGKEKALNGLVGQVMKASKGKANPGQVNQILRAKLSA